MLLSLNEYGKVTKVKNSNNDIFEIKDIVKSTTINRKIIIESFIGDKDSDTIYAVGKDGLGTPHSLNIEYLKVCRDLCYECKTCKNYCSITGKKLL